jgi:hypothetical protein
MPDVVKSIGTDSRDYSTITAWEAGIDNTTYPDADTHVIGECYNDSAFDESVTINASASNVTKITRTVAEGERHDGTAGTGARIVASGSRIVTLSSAAAIPITWSWLEHNHNGNASNTPVLLPGSGSNDNSTSRTIQNIIVHGNPGASNRCTGLYHAYDGPVNILNSLWYDLDYPFNIYVGVLIFNGTASASVVVNNCTVHGCVSAHSSTFGITGGTGATVTNTVVTDVVGTSDGVCFGTINAASSHNASSDLTASGTGSLTEIDPADQYVSTVEGSEDLHLKSGADCIDAGTDLGTSPTGVNIDINGRDRDAEGDTWDIGADEWTADDVPVPGSPWYYNLQQTLLAG